MPTKPAPELPEPSTDHDLRNIKSEDWLKMWDTYVITIIKSLHDFHGAESMGSATAAAKYAAAAADAIMELRQERAQGHIDQGIVEKAKAKEDKAKDSKTKDAKK